MRKFPNITCDRKNTEFDKDAQGEFVNHLKIEQDGKNVSIIRKNYNPYTNEEMIDDFSGTVVAFNDEIKIAKIKLADDSYRRYDYQEESFDLKRVESYFYFRVNNFKYNNTTINNFTKFINIALSIATIDTFAFYFLSEAKLTDNKQSRNSNEIRGYKINQYYKSDDYKEFKMKLLSPSSVLFDIELGVNFLDFNQGYLRLCCLHELSKLIFDKIRRFFHQNHNFEEI